MILVSLAPKDTFHGFFFLWEKCAIVPKNTWEVFEFSNGKPEAREGEYGFYYLCIEWYSKDAQFYIESGWIDSQTCPVTIHFSNKETNEHQANRD